MAAYSPTKPVKTAGLVAVMLNLVLLGTAIASPLWRGDPVAWETVLRVMQLGILWSVFPLATIIPALLWRWGEGACFAWSLGYLALITTILFVVTSRGSRPLSSDVAPVSFFLALSVGLMVFAWLQRKFGVPQLSSSRGNLGLGPKRIAPSWLPETLALDYRQVNGLRTSFVVLRGRTSDRVRVRDEEMIRDYAEFAASERRERDAYPESWRARDEELLQDLERGWYEFDLAEGEGEFLIDPDVKPETQILGDRVRGMGQEDIHSHGRRFKAARLRSESEVTCECVEMAQHVLFWVGPGRCWRCSGILSKLRNCKKCGGTGRCDQCLGDGIHHWEVDSWYEANTGLLLRRTEMRNGKRIRESELESVVPDILAGYAS